MAALQRIDELVKRYPNFPQPGILFYDSMCSSPFIDPSPISCTAFDSPHRRAVFPLFYDPVAVEIVLNEFFQHVTKRHERIDVVVHTSTSTAWLANRSSED